MLPVRQIPIFKTHHLLSPKIQPKKNLKFNKNETTTTSTEKINLRKQIFKMNSVDFDLKRKKTESHEENIKTKIAINMEIPSKKTKHKN